ncbi:MAG: hypothetical protein HRU33_11655 [Rhodobacteraceae bacterium]|nr:hypothetical protein [Paracoccaceae bacterium]
MKSSLSLLLIGSPTWRILSHCIHWVIRAHAIEGSKSGLAVLVLTLGGTSVATALELFPLLIKNSACPCGGRIAF